MENKGKERGFQLMKPCKRVLEEQDNDVPLKVDYRWSSCISKNEIRRYDIPGRIVKFFIKLIATIILKYTHFQ